MKKMEQLAKALKSGKELKGYLKNMSLEKGAPKTAEACKTQVSKLKTNI